MHPLFQWLSSHTYALVFVVVLGGILLGKVTFKGYGLGMAASTAVIALAVSATSYGAGVKLGVDDFTQSFFVALFMYGLGLRIGPSLHHAFSGDGLKLTGLAVLCSTLALALTTALARLWDLPPGAAGGILAGAMTAPAALGPAQEALKQSAEVNAMIGLSYALTCVWGALGILLVCRYLPSWWGIDVRAEARKHEERLGVPNFDEAGLTGYQPLAVRAFRLTNDALTGWTVKRFGKEYPHYRVLNVLRPQPARRSAVEANGRVVALDEALLVAAGGRQLTVVRDHGAMPPPLVATAGRGMLPPTQYAKLGASPELAFRQGDILTLCGGVGAGPRNPAFIGPEINDPAALNVPLDAAEILVTHPAIEGRELRELGDSDIVGQVAIHHIERGGVPIPLGLHVKLQRYDVLFVAGVKSGVDRLAAMAGHTVRASASAELVMLSAGMILGLAIGSGVGNAIGLLIAGILVSTRGRTSSTARDMLLEFGLVAFIAMVGLNAGAALVGQLSGELATKILVAGFFVGTLPPVIAWVVGLHVLKLNPAVLVGGVAGARAHPDPAREAVKEIASPVPWVGFPVAYAVSVLLLAIFGHVATIVSR